MPKIQTTLSYLSSALQHARQCWRVGTAPVQHPTELGIPALPRWTSWISASKSITDLQLLWLPLSSMTVKGFQFKCY